MASNIDIVALGSNVSAAMVGGRVQITVDNSEAKDAVDRANAAADNANTAALNGVRTDTPTQNLNETQQANARGNINRGRTATSDTTAVNGDVITADTTGGSFAITLPDNPSPGEVVTIHGSGWSVNPLQIVADRTIAGAPSPWSANIENAELRLRAIGLGWSLETTFIASDLEQLSDYPAQSLREIWIDPKLYRTAIDADDTNAIAKARARALETKQRVVLGAGEYVTSEPFLIVTGLGLHIGTGASLKASPTFTGSALVRVGTTITIADSWEVSGKGLIDCDKRCDFGIEVVYGRFARIDHVEVAGAQVSPIVIGSTEATAKSYEVNVFGTTVSYPDEANTEDGIGVWHRDASDCYCSQVISRGYRKGFRTESVSGNITFVQCHPWIRPEHGVMTHGFDIYGSNNAYFDCYSDTPTNYGDPTITDCYGFYNAGFSNRFYGCAVLLNTATFGGALATDGVVTCFYGGANLKGEIFGLRGVGSSVTKRFKALTQGPAGALDATYRVDGLNDDGASRFTAADPGRGIIFSNRHPISYNSTVTFNGFATFGIGLSALSLRVAGAAGTNRDAVFATDVGGSFLDRWRVRVGSSAESGGNAGSPFQINAYDDAGNFLSTAVTIARGTSEITTAGGISLATNKTYKINGTQVVTSRRTGWVAATGTASRATFDTATATTADVAQRLKALIDDLTTHGLIGS